MQPFSPHTKFFSSLKQVEKRLKSEDATPSSTPDELSEPLYLYPPSNQPQHSTFTTQDSNPPLEFLTPPSPHLQSQQPPDDFEEEDDDDKVDGVQQLLQLLGLSDMDGRGGGYAGSFLARVVGVKGPRSDKERERLDGWIQYFLSGDDEGGRGVKEPLRLVHLLIGKAVVVRSEDEDGGGFGDLEFPATVDDFLECDPPLNTS